MLCDNYSLNDVIIFIGTEVIRSLLKISDKVAEWLRRWTANPFPSGSVGSNPILVEYFCTLNAPIHLCIQGQKSWPIVVPTSLYHRLEFINNSGFGNSLLIYFIDGDFCTSVTFLKLILDTGRNKIYRKHQSVMLDIIFSTSS